jgi:hypothetical protein
MACDVCKQKGKYLCNLYATGGRRGKFRDSHYFQGKSVLANKIKVLIFGEEFLYNAARIFVK